MGRQCQKMGSKLRQKDIVYINLDPTSGKEQKGKRPAVIVSGEDFHVSGLVIVCPVTTKIKNYFGDVILKPDKTNCLKQESEILVGQIRTVDISRCNKKIGHITDEELNKVLQGFGWLCNRF